MFERCNRCKACIKFQSKNCYGIRRYQRTGNCEEEIKDGKDSRDRWGSNYYAKTEAY